MPGGHSLAVLPSWGSRPLDRDFASHAFAWFALFSGAILRARRRVLGKRYQPSHVMRVTGAACAQAHSWATDHALCRRRGLQVVEAAGGAAPRSATESALSTAFVQMDDRTRARRESRQKRRRVPGPVGFRRRSTLGTTRRTGPRRRELASREQPGPAPAGLACRRRLPEHRRLAAA